MLRDITLGQYYSADSFLHRLDPRVKIRFTLFYIIVSLFDRNLPFFLLLTAICVLEVLLSKVPVRYILKGMRGILVFIFVCSALNIFTTRGEAFVSVGAVAITKEGLLKASFVFWRMMMLIIVASLLTYTTTPTELTDGLEKCFHLSAGVAVGITIALRFISVLSEELSRIMRAQEARGVDFHQGGPITRFKKLKTVIVPLFQNAINRAGNLGDAMDARCYTGGKGRTKLKPLKYDGKDIIGYIFMIVFLVLSIWLIIQF